MPEYTVTFTTVASVNVRVEADDVDDAIDKAWDDAAITLCHQCARKVEVGDELEPDRVFDESTGDTVWERKTGK